MSDPRLSIVIPNHNYGRFFSRLALSLQNQTLGLDVCEIILVDDGSTDDSLDLLHHFEALPCLRFQALAEAHDGHPGTVRNKGLATAQGRYLVCLDPDDLPAPGWLAACIAALEADKDAGLAYTHFTLVEKDGPREVRLPEYDPALLRNQNIVAPTALMRREVFEASDGYRANTAYEDWDFWIQAASNGFGLRRVDALLYAHMVHGDNFSFSAREEDGAAKAAIVLNNPGFFPAGVRHWAGAVLAGEAWAWPFPRGIIPTLQDVEKLLKTVKSNKIGN
ncbi:glycosyltransferase family 2 protein [Salidesulfovibrio onnuriiensis]|uniref:glycosyltransferase family 2 protein n=1 Tax=Salidesulfovibrio onnuriiensis TaxID=2583823 RepID=UPI0011CAD1B0|nr:glycosyltransferase family A protein [Salidesulfovibrio onnuriiensis]